MDWQGFRKIKYYGTVSQTRHSKLFLHSKALVKCFCVPIFFFGLEKKIPIWTFIVLVTYIIYCKPAYWFLNFVLNLCNCWFVFVIQLYSCISLGINVLKWPWVFPFKTIISDNSQQFGKLRKSPVDIRPSLWDSTVLFF